MNNQQRISVVCMLYIQRNWCAITNKRRNATNQILYTIVSIHPH